MDLEELLSLITLGAVFPYISIAATDWLKRICGEHGSGANAPS